MRAFWERKRPGWGARRVALERADTARHFRVALDVALDLEGGQALLDGELADSGLGCQLSDGGRVAFLRPERPDVPERFVLHRRGGRLHDRTSRDPSPFIGPTIFSSSISSTRRAARL